MDREEITLATELMWELKASARRWFIAFIIMCVIEACTIAGFLWYMSLPTEEYSVEQDTDRGGNNFAVGGDFNGETADNV